MGGMQVNHCPTVHQAANTLLIIMASIKSTLLTLLFSLVLVVLRMGGVAEACPPSEPPPCLTAMCACAGGGFSGAGLPVIPRTCISFFDPCSNSNDLCNQCYRESGCSTSKLVDGEQRNMTCSTANKDGTGPVTCIPGQHPPEGK